MRLILVGPPASGKGTQAAIIKEKLNIAHISTGDMLRAAIKNGTPLGKEADNYMSKGQLVPDELVIKMVQERLKESDAENGFLLDGFPRTAPQAKALDEALEASGQNIDVVVFIDVPDSVVLERMTGRRTDPVTGNIYHTVFNPPPAEIADRVVQRDDDNEESVKVRLEKYHSETEPIIDFYKEKGILKTVDACRKPEEISADIFAALGV
jgi:adenylate kinase